MTWKHEEVFTFQIILDRLPLPEQTFMGYWIIGQNRNGMQKLLCPAETHPIDIKVDINFSFLIKILNVTDFSLSFLEKIHTVSEMTCSDVILEQI